MTSTLTNTEKNSSLIQSIISCIKEMARIRQTIGEMKATNQDFIYIELAYSVKKMQDELKAYMLTRLKTDISNVPDAYNYKEPELWI